MCISKFLKLCVVLNEGICISDEKSNIKISYLSDKQAWESRNILNSSSPANSGN